MSRHCFVGFWVILLAIGVFVACDSGDTNDNLDGDNEDGDVADGDTPDPDGDTDGDDPDGDTPDGDSDGDAPDGDADGDADGDVPDGDEPQEVVPSWPDCGSGSYDGNYLIAGPGEAAYNADLATKADRYDRQFHLLACAPYGATTDASVPVANSDNRALIEDFLQNSDSWDFETYSGGKTAYDVISGWSKTAGLYGGIGIVADALRYQTLRDQGASCDTIAQARAILKADLDFMHIAFTIGGEPGVVVRGLMRRDVPGDAANVETIPLFDENDNPLPETKNNGAWRDDNSGLYDGWVFEDSCSRDMLLGWAAAAGVCAEVMRFDDSFDATLKDRLKADAKMALDGLRTVRESGYDLELIDADGRTTLHGYLNEHAVESSLYSDSFENGFYAIMALGIVGAFAYAADDPDGWAYLNDELIAERELPRIALEHPTYINMGITSNYSNYNMALTGGWLAMRYIHDTEARASVREAIKVSIYDTPDEDYQPAGAKMTLYDFIVAYTDSDASIWALPTQAPGNTVSQDGLDTLQAYGQPPYWNYEVINCDEQELESGRCELLDGTQVEVFDEGGRKDSTVCNVPIPKAIRRPSNYEWRSNPYNPNGGGDGSGFYSGVDFRIGYWLGRSIRLPDAE